MTLADLVVSFTVLMMLFGVYFIVEWIWDVWVSWPFEE